MHELEPVSTLPAADQPRHAHQEVVDLLAAGLLRLRARRDSSPTCSRDEVGLGFVCHHHSAPNLHGCVFPHRMAGWPHSAGGAVPHHLDTAVSPIAVLRRTAGTRRRPFAGDWLKSRRENQAKCLSGGLEALPSGGVEQTRREESDRVDRSTKG